MAVIGVIQFAVQFGALWRAGVQRLEKLLNERISAEFQTERIRKTVTDVATGEATKLLKDSVQPQIDTVRRETQDKVNAFDAFLRQLREENAKTYATLTSEVDILKDRNRLMGLADRAVNDGDRRALEELMRFRGDEESPLRQLASSLMFQVKNFYLSGSRITGHELAIKRFARLATDTARPPPKEENYSTDDLIYALKEAEDWRDRAKAAQLLRSRRIRVVPDALLQSILKDNHLEVVRDAVQSFCALTAYKSTDVFGQDGIERWWQEHQTEILPRLGEP